MPNSIVVLTGAGISAESGIKTFRASDGLWEEHRVEEVATPEAFQRDPELVHRFYNARRNQLLSDEVKPNAAHFALAELEDKFQGDFLLVTQNIDNLHERAGSQHLIHMHGELLQQRCVNSGQVFSIQQDSSPASVCCCCQQSGNLRPNIVWFGEMPMQMEKIYTALEQCDLFISIGTSGHVYPAAGFVQVANEVGAATVEVNLEPSNVSSAFDITLHGKAGEQLPLLVEQILKQD